MTQTSSKTKCSIQSHQASLAKPHTWGGSSYSGASPLLFHSPAFQLKGHVGTEHRNGSLRCTWASGYSREWERVTFLFVYIRLFRKISGQRAGNSPRHQEIWFFPERFFWKDLRLEHQEFLFYLFFVLMQDLISSVHARCVIPQVCAK